MKKVIAGTGFMIMGGLLVLAAALSAAFLTTQITEWWSNLGKFGTAIIDNIPIIVMLGVGVVFIVIGAVYAFSTVMGRSYGGYEEEEERDYSHQANMQQHEPRHYEQPTAKRGSVARREFKPKEFEEFELGDLEIEQKPEDDE